jgi:membrane carboxypeptidase/penicillin-binding protein
MTNAFAILANNGKEVKPSLIDYIQDRNGKVIFRNDTRCGPWKARATRATGTAGRCRARRFAPSR